MLALGCLFPVVLLVAGGGIGFAVGSTAMGLWGAGVGFVLGCIALLGMLWGFERLRNR